MTFENSPRPLFRSMAILVSMVALVLLAGCETSVQRAQSELDRGNELFNKSNSSGAIDAFSNAISEQGELADAYFRRGIAHSGQGDHARAIVDHKDAVRMNPDYPPYRFARALAFLCDEQYDEARRDFEAVLKLDPSDELGVKTKEMLVLTEQAKKARAGDSATIATVIGGSSEPVQRKSWIEVGLLGRSRFRTKNPVLAIVLFIILHAIVANALLITMRSSYGQNTPLDESQKGAISFLGIIIGVASFFFAWGYGHWGLWIVCVIWTLGISGNQIKIAAGKS